MSGQPSLSKSMNPQPGPELSGRYFCGDLPAECFQVIPLLDGGTASKLGDCWVGCEIAVAAREATTATVRITRDEDSFSKKCNDVSGEREVSITGMSKIKSVL